jgi:hypothetical protein
MKLTNEHILANTESTAVAAGVSVDGLFFKRNSSFGGGLTVNYFAIGFNPANNNSIDFDAPSGVTFNFNQNIVLGSGVTSTLKANGIDFASGTGTAWTVTAVNGDLKLQTLNPVSTISLNNAVVVRDNRLAQGLPFPVTQVVSTDANTLDDYEEGTWTPVLYGGALQNQATTNPSFKRLMTDTAGPAGTGTPLGGPARAYYTAGGPVYQVGLYGPLGSGSGYTWRDIPIDVTYARYVKVGKKVTCWVNFAINPSFNWITTLYTGAWNSVNTLTQVFTAGTNASRCDFLYDVNQDWSNSCAIGLTLPFGAAVAPSAGSTSFSLYDPDADQLSSTVLAGTYNLQIDNNVSGLPNPFGLGPNYPIVHYPAFYQNPLTVSAGVASGGGVETGGAIGLVSNMLPINPTGKSEIRIGVVNTRVTVTGSPFFDYSVSYSPAALFFGERDFADTNAFTSSGGRRTFGTSRLSPVTALDCLYEAWIPAAGNTADANIVDKLIRFQCHFTYETAT